MKFVLFLAVVGVATASTEVETLLHAASALSNSDLEALIAGLQTRRSNSRFFPSTIDSGRDLSPRGVNKNPPPIPTKTLHPSGLELPYVGFGTAFGDQSSQSFNNTLAEIAVTDWINLGGRGIDGAFMYCTQPGVGAALKKTKVPRSEIVLTTKVPTWYMGYNLTMQSFAESLKMLGTDYVDLYVVHWPAEFPDRWPQHWCGPADIAREITEPPCKKGSNNWKECRMGTWKAMVELKKAGKIKALGVSNYETWHIQEIIDSGMDLPDLNQVEYHIGWHQDDLTDFCNKHKISLQAYELLARGSPKLTRHGNDTIITAVADAHNVSVAQVAEKYALQKGIPIVVQSTNVDYMAEDMDVFGFTITDAEMTTLDNIQYIPKFCPDPAAIMCTDKNGKMSRCQANAHPSTVVGGH